MLATCMFLHTSYTTPRVSHLDIIQTVNQIVVPFALQKDSILTYLNIMIELVYLTYSEVSFSCKDHNRDASDKQIADIKHHYSVAQCV